MIVIVGLVILVAAVIAGVGGVLSNSGHAHAVGHFSMFGYHVTGSTGTLFLYGIVVGAVGVLGLSLLLAGARRTSRRGRAARQDLKQSRRETAAVSQDRDDLIGQRDTARAYTASDLGDVGTGRNGDSPGILGRMFGRRAAPRQVGQARSQERAPVQTAGPQAAPVAAEPENVPAIPAAGDRSADIPVSASAE
jgi:hypothetical protein